MSPSFDTTLRQNVTFKLARRTPCWPGPGNATTESPPLVVPSGLIPYSLAEEVTDWVNNFSNQCIADGQRPDARVAMDYMGGGSYMLRAVS